MSEGDTPGKLSDFIRELEELQELDDVVVDRLDRLAVAATDSRARDPEKEAAEVADACVETLEALGERQERMGKVAAAYGQENLNAVSGMSAHIKRLAEIAGQAPSIARVMERLSRELPRPDLTRLTPLSKSLSRVMKEYERQFRSVDDLVRRMAREAAASPSVMDYIPKLMGPVDVGRAFSQAPLSAVGPLSDSIIRQVEEQQNYWGQMRPYYGLFQEVFGEQVQQWTVSVAKQLVEAGAFEGDPTDDEVVARVKEAIPERLRAGSILRRSGAPSWEALLDGLRDAGFGACEQWSLTDFDTLVDAGVFIDAPDASELKQRVVAMLPDKMAEVDVELDVQQAADLLGITPHALHQRIRTARARKEPMPFRNIGNVGSGKLLVWKRELLEWANMQRGRGRPKGS